MTAIEPLLRQPAAQAIGWALLQFIWQGALIGAVTAIALTVLRRSAADVRYVVASIGLSLMLTVPVVTAVQGWRAAAMVPDDVQAPAVPVRTFERAGVAASAPQIVEPLIPAGDPAPAAARVNGRIDMAMPLLLLVWASGVLVLSLRLISGWLWVQRMRTHGTSAAAERWQQMAARLSRQLHIGRTVRLVESTLVDVPTVIGWLKPVVLLPASALAGLAPNQLEAVLAHEMAHIRRHDYLVNFVQTLVETLLFYHPAVWWLSHRIRVERENCCDDLAVSLCGDPYTYASALADLEELRGSRARLVLAVTGGSLLQRVRRLLGASSHAGTGPGWLAGSAAVVLITGVTIAAVGQSVLGSAESPSAQTSTSSGRVNEPAQLTREAAQMARETSQLLREAQRTFVEMSRSINEVMRSLAGITIVSPDLARQGPPQPPQPPLPPLPPQPPARDGRATEAGEVQARMADVAREMEQRAVEMAAVAGTQAQAAAAMDAAQSALAAATQSMSSRTIQGDKGRSGTFTWSNGTEKLKVEYKGDVEFTDDDRDVAKMSPGAYLKMADGGWFASHTIEFRADESGNVQRRYWAGSSEKPFDPEGRQWLSTVLPRFIRQTGIGARQRVARFLKAGGPQAVLAEISKIEGSWAKRRYFSELIAAATLDAQTARQALAQAGREIDSDFELASLLIETADRLLVDESARAAYFEAAKSIDSDFEARRVYSAALKRGAISPQLLAGILAASTTIESDFELASLLIDIARLQPLDAASRQAFFKAVGTIESDHEHRRVLDAITERDGSPETLQGVVESASSIESDFELASLLLEVTRQRAPEGSLRAPFFRGVTQIASAFERGRVLKAVVSRQDASVETIVAVLKSLDGLGDHETGQVLVAIARTRQLTGESRDRYLQAAERLGDFQQNQALAALVKSEKR